MLTRWIRNSIGSIVFGIICGTCYSASLGAPGNIEVSDFRHGLVEFDAQDRPRIYKEGFEFPYEVNGTCIAAGKSYPCLWYGFEFSYKSEREVSVFDCVSMSDRPQTHVYPGAVIAKDTETIRYGFTVKGRTGRYIRPQYTFDVKGRPLRMTDVCTVNGQEVLKWQVTLTPPPAVVKAK